MGRKSQRGEESVGSCGRRRGGDGNGRTELEKDHAGDGNSHGGGDADHGSVSRELHPQERRTGPGGFRQGPRKAKAPKASKAERLKAAAKSININTASAEDLTACPASAPSRPAIVEYRTAHKGFKSVDELRNVKGVGPKLLDGIKPYVAL